MKISVCLFAYGGVEPETVQSLVQESITMKDAEFTFIWDDPNISRSRSFIASRFLDGPGDVLFMIDHDMSFPQGSIGKLSRIALSENAVVSAISSKRVKGSGLTSDTSGYKRKDGIIETKWLASNFTAYSREALKKIKEHESNITEVEPNGFFFPMMVGGNWLADDLAFSYRATLSDVPLLIYPMVIGHHGKTVFLPEKK